MKAKALVLTGIVILAVFSIHATELTPLRIISKELSPEAGSRFTSKASGELVGPHTMRITLRNHSDKTITAYQISGILDTGRGDYSLWSDTIDGYEALIFGKTLTPGQSVISPGEAVILDVPDNRQPGLGFYSAQLVRVDAVIFDDMTAAGDPKVIKQLRQARLEKLIELLNATGGLVESLGVVSIEIKSHDRTSLQYARTRWLSSWIAAQARRQESQIEAAMKWRDRLQGDFIALENLVRD